MLVKVAAKRQVTFPARVLELLGVKPGDRLELQEGPEGFVLRPRRIDLSLLAPLRGKLRRGKGTFDLEAFRSQPRAPSLVEALTALIETGAEVFASNQVIGEASIAIQHHYGVAKADARHALTTVLSSGLVAPLNGAGIMTAIEATTGCGLLDRLIADDHRRAALMSITLDRKMAALPDVRRL